MCGHHHEPCFSDPINFENRLLRDLHEDYNRHARPISDVHAPIDVYISFYLTKILGLVSQLILLYVFICEFASLI